MDYFVCCFHLQSHAAAYFCHHGYSDMLPRQTCSSSSCTNPRQSQLARWTFMRMQRSHGGQLPWLACRTCSLRASRCTRDMLSCSSVLGPLWSGLHAHADPRALLYLQKKFLWQDTHTFNYTNFFYFVLWAVISTP